MDSGNLGDGRLAEAFFSSYSLGTRLVVFTDTLSRSVIEIKEIINN